MANTPWDIYARALLPLGYGYPLWSPEPSDSQVGSVDFGDVGYIEEGSFCFLFSAMNPQKNVRGSPDGYMPLVFGATGMMTSTSTIDQTLLTARGMQSMWTEATVGNIGGTDSKYVSF